MNKALVVVDMQKDFINGALGTSEAQEILPTVRELIESSETCCYDIFFTRDTHFSDYLETAEGKHLPVEHCIKFEEGWEIEGSVLNAAHRPIIVDKPTFGSTELIEYLEDYDVIGFCGVCTDICVISNVLLAKATYPEKRIVVWENACAGVTPEKHAAAIEVMKSCQVEVLEVLEQE